MKHGLPIVPYSSTRNSLVDILYLSGYSDSQLKLEYLEDYFNGKEPDSRAEILFTTQNYDNKSFYPYEFIADYIFVKPPRIVDQTTDLAPTYEFFSFCKYDPDSRSYVRNHFFTLKYFEEIVIDEYTAENLSQYVNQMEGNKFYSEKAITIMSEYQYFSCFFNILERIKNLFVPSEDIPPEIDIYNIINFLPAPFSPVSLMIKQYYMGVNLRKLNGYPIIDLNLEAFLTRLTVKGFLKLFLLTFLEVKVVLFNEDPLFNSILIQLLSNLNFPFNFEEYFKFACNLTVETFMDEEKNYTATAANIVAVNGSIDSIDSFDVCWTHFVAVTFEEKKENFYPTVPSKMAKDEETKESIKQIEVLLEFVDNLSATTKPQKLLEKLIKDIFVVLDGSLKQKKAGFSQIYRNYGKKNEQLQELFYNFIVESSVYKLSKYKPRYEEGSLIYSEAKVKQDLNNIESLFVFFFDQSQKNELFERVFCSGDLISPENQTNIFLFREFAVQYFLTRRRGDYFSCIDEVFFYDKDPVNLCLYQMFGEHEAELERLLRSTKLNKVEILNHDDFFNNMVKKKIRLNKNLILKYTYYMEYNQLTELFSRWKRAVKPEREVYCFDKLSALISSFYPAMAEDTLLVSFLIQMFKKAREQCPKTDFCFSLVNLIDLLLKFKSRSVFSHLLTSLIDAISVFPSPNELELLHGFFISNEILLGGLTSEKIKMVDGLANVTKSTKDILFLDRVECEIDQTKCKKCKKALCEEEIKGSLFNWKVKLYCPSCKTPVHPLVETHYKQEKTKKKCVLLLGNLFPETIRQYSKKKSSDGTSFKQLISNLIVRFESNKEVKTLPFLQLIMVDE